MVYTENGTCTAVRRRPPHHYALPTRSYAPPKSGSFLPHCLGPQPHVNHLNICRDRGIDHQLKLSLQIVGKGFGFLRI